MLNRRGETSPGFTHGATLIVAVAVAVVGLTVLSRNFEELRGQGASHPSREVSQHPEKARNEKAGNNDAKKELIGWAIAELQRLGADELEGETDWERAVRKLVFRGQHNHRLMYLAAFETVEVDFDDVPNEITTTASRLSEEGIVSEPITFSSFQAFSEDEVRRELHAIRTKARDEARARAQETGEFRFSVQPVQSLVYARTRDQFPLGIPEFRTQWAFIVEQSTPLFLSPFEFYDVALVEKTGSRLISPYGMLTQPMDYGVILRDEPISVTFDLGEVPETLRFYTFMQIVRRFFPSYVYHRERGLAMYPTIWEVEGNVGIAPSLQRPPNVVIALMPGDTIAFGPKLLTAKTVTPSEVSFSVSFPHPASTYPTRDED